MDRQNDRYRAKSVEDVKGTFCTKHTAQIMVLGVINPNGRRCPPMFSSLGREWGLKCTKRSCSTILFCWLKAGHPQEQVCVNPGPCQVLHGEKGMAILQDKFYRFLPLLQPRPEPTGHCWLWRFGAFCH